MECPNIEKSLTTVFIENGIRYDRKSGKLVGIVEYKGGRWLAKFLPIIDEKTGLGKPPVWSLQKSAMFDSQDAAGYWMLAMWIEYQTRGIKFANGDRDNFDDPQAA